MRLVSILPVVIVAALPIPGLAQSERDDMLVTAVVYSPLPESAAFRLRMRDDTELSHQIRRLVAASLESRGYAVRNDAPLVIDIEAEVYRPPVREYDGMGEIDIDSGGLEITVNLWSSNEDSLLRRQRNPDPLPDREFRISLAIHGADHQGHICRYLWRGEVAELRQTDTPVIASRRMVPALVAAIGETVTAATLAEH
ncbi:hypothetical protein [Rhodospirillaceae bacterium SYSU D60014]|uniref:hypothetical protein n=1 Tax=Virgifigura deserti TaxID=2268457 RepID=UPI000E66DF93